MGVATWERKFSTQFAEKTGREGGGGFVWVGVGEAPEKGARAGAALGERLGGFDGGA